MPLPDYINCDSKYVVSCDFFITQDCPNTCAYAKGIEGLEVGAIVVSLGLEKNVSDEYGNMKYTHGELNPSYSE